MRAPSLAMDNYRADAVTIGPAIRLLVAMVLLAGCFPLISLGLTEAPHLAFAAMRAAIAGACLATVGLAFRRAVPRGWHAWALIGASGLGATTLGFLGMFHAAEFLSPGLATVIVNLQPLFAAFFGGILLRERLSALGTAGLLAGLAGVAVVASPSFAADAQQGGAVGIAYAVLAAVGAAVGNLAMKRLAGRVDTTMATGLQLLIGSVPLALLSTFVVDTAPLAWSVRFALTLGVLSVFGTALAFWLWFSALERVELVQANAFTFLVPLFSLGLGAAFFGERLGGIEAAGGALILVGVLLVQLNGSSRTVRIDTQRK